MNKHFITEQDRYYFGQGCHYEVYNKLGAHLTQVDGQWGVHFAVWAPNAVDVRIVGDFNDWSEEAGTMTLLETSGIWETFVPGAKQWDKYKFAIKTKDDRTLMKADPYAYHAETRPGNASKVADINSFEWSDKKWMKKTEEEKNEKYRKPMSIYEVHIGSWKKDYSGNADGFLDYRRLAHELADYVEQMGYTHVELMGILEHPLDASWGYQVTGYYAPTSRYGAPEDFMYFVDYLHKKNIGVILDWVPAHFPKDDYALAEFDGTCLYEYPDPRKGEHPDWGTKVFNYEKNEVKNFLIANALFWVEKYHIDALRVDAVASMLYLDYGRSDGNWVPNIYGGNKNLEAIEFFKHLNSIMEKRCGRAYLMAEESTAWPKVTEKPENDGLGFAYKWNMGWMNDFLEYMKLDPLYRKYNHNKMTFSLTYAFSEKYVLVLSHDEVVHLKCSMYNKMPGYPVDKAANLKMAYTYMFGHPGKKLLFMGQDYGMQSEWMENKDQEWHLLDQPMHAELHDYTKQLLQLYKKNEVLYKYDEDYRTFRWINCDDAERSIFSFIRKEPESYDGALLFICNFTPVERTDYCVGVPVAGTYKRLLTNFSTITEADTAETAATKRMELAEEEKTAKYKAAEGECDGLPYRLNICLRPFEAMVIKFPQTSVKDKEDGKENGKKQKQSNGMTGETVKTVADLVRMADLVYGNRVFVRYEKDELIKEVTYNEFRHLCQSVAAWTENRSNAIGHKARVGIFGGSSKSFLAALFGVMANGNVAVPLDIQSNLATLIDCVSRAELDYLFYDWEYKELVDAVIENCPNLKDCICLQNRKHVDSIYRIWKDYTRYELKKDINPKDCALVLFTSGTTGKGKGVMLSHENLISNVFCTDFDKHEPDEVCLNVLPVHHVFCLHGDFLMTLKDGNVICLNQDMRKLGAHLQLFQPTTIAMVPMIAKALINKIVMLRTQYKDLSDEKIKELVFGKRISKIACGGGYLAPELAKQYREIGVVIGQGYGMTECSPKISAADFSRPDKAASVGKIVDGCRVRLVDGEIQVKSPSVMMGYYNDPEETAKVFTEDGWLKTGDLGYFDDEGFLFFTGRCKNLIVLSNGENVAPEQLENMFENEKLIEDILVFGEDDKICAEVYPNFQVAETMGIEDIEKTVTEIVQKMNQELPTYKRILQTYVRYTPFEKTASKKIIRDKFFEQKRKKKEEKKVFKKPENDMQQVIFDSVAESLGHGEFGIDTDFYEAGLDSLGCVLLLSGLYEKLKLSITLAELSANATVEKLEKFAMKKKETAVDYSLRETYPLIGIQKYFGYILRGNTTSNLPFLFKLDKSVDLKKLKKATEDVFEVHPEMKNIIQPGNGMLENFRNDKRKITIPIIKLSDAEWEETRKGLIQPFMYTEGESVFHAAIYKTGSGNYFFFDLGHIMGDGMSMNIIFEDINALYLGKKLEKQSYTMYEYILDDQERIRLGKRQEYIENFKKMMENLKIKKSIMNRKDYHDLDKGITGVINGELDGLSKKAVQAFCNRHNVSENVFFLSAFTYCISLFANEDDVVCTSTHSGRTDSRWYRVIGPLYMTYYFRFTRKPHETVPELLQKSAAQILKTMDNHLTNVKADEIFFQYQGDILGIDTIGGAPAELQDMQLDAMPFHMQVMTNKKGYYYQLRYWENRFDRETLEVFLRCYRTVLEAMMTESSVRRLRKYVADSDKPKHFYVEAGKLNEAAGFELLSGVPADMKVKAYVLDDTYLKKPFGAWGNLYIQNYPTRDYVDKIDNPSGNEEGVLYQTGHVARITPDGEVEFLENTGRTVMLETLMGRVYVDLCKVENVLCGCEGVTSAKAYTYYGGDNVILVGADVTGIEEKDIERVLAYAAEQLDKVSIPSKLVCM